MKNVGMMNRAVAMGLVVAAGLASSASLAAAAVGPIEVIYCKKTGHPKAAFTGSVDINGNPENVEWKAMEDMIVSPDGSRWVLKARSTSAGTSDTGYVVGSGTTGTVFSAGGFRFLEGQPAMTTGGGTDGFMDFVPTGFARFNTNNKMVFSFRARTTTTGSTSSPAAMRVATWDGTNLVFRFKMTDPYTGMQDTGSSGDETVGNSAGSYHLLDNDTIGNHDPNPGSLSSTRYPVLAYNQAMFKQTGVSSWLALDGVSTLLATTIDAGSFFTTPDGLHHMLMFKSGPIATRISHFVKDGQVLFSQDVAITGSSVVPGAFFQNTMANNGDYMLRGRDNSGTSAAAPDWVVRNGVLVAKTGDPITPGSTELWGDTFSAVALNGTGDYIIVGNTTAGDAGANEVVVLNGTTVVMREGDAIDLDGNGQFDDNVFIGRGNNTLAAFGASTTNGQSSWSLTDDRVLYAIIQLRDGSGSDLNVVPAFGTPQAFVRVDLDAGGGCTADFNGTGGVTADDIFAFLDAWFVQNGTCTSNCTADFNGTGGVTADDIFAFLDAWFAQNGTCN